MPKQNGTENASLKVFISHIDEDRELASVLKRWIEAAFLGEVKVFVSSHDISSGEQWFTRLEEELAEAVVMLVLCSSKSVARPWVNFETGAGHIKGMPIIPICYSEMALDTLPKPLLFFQGLAAETDDFSSAVMKDLSKHLGFSREPLVPHEDMSAEVKSVLSAFAKQTPNPDQEEEREKEPEEVEEENGYIDQLVLFLDNMAELTNLISVLGSESKNIATETTTLTNRLANTRTSKSQSIPRQMQRLARNYSTKLNAYANYLTQLNVKYSALLPKVDSSSQYVIEFQSPQTNEDWKAIEELQASMTDAETGVSSMKTQASRMLEVMDAIPNYQKDLKEASRRTSEQYTLLIGNINGTLEMIQRMKVSLTSLERNRFPI